MRFRLVGVLICLLFSAVAARGDDSAKGSPAPQSARPLKTRNLILVTTDGLRWEEVFGGGDPSLMTKKEGGVSQIPELRRDFFRETPKERREAMMPFLWGEIARHGQIFGNAEIGSVASVTNGHNFSYPGYNEIFTGKADPRVDSNDKVPNPNVTVFEWLESQPEYRGKVAAFGSWSVFDAILNAARGKFHENSGFEPLEVPDMNPGVTLLNRLLRETPTPWDGERYDSMTFHMGMEYFRQMKPRVFFLGFGDTDEYAHAGRYDRYLRAARRVDDYLKELWETVQAIPEYRGTTTLIVSTDHGRGAAEGGGWKSHGVKHKGSDKIWIAVMGPDTPPMGERTNVSPVTQSQIAATLSALLGKDYRGFAPDAAPPIEDVVGRK